MKKFENQQYESFENPLTRFKEQLFCDARERRTVDDC